jgi:hypothetical protein
MKTIFAQNDIMKQKILYIIFFLTLTFVFIGLPGLKNKYSYKNASFSLPSLEVLELDSLTFINTTSVYHNKASLIMYFSPDCEHCQQQTLELLEQIKSFKGVQICLLSPMSISDLRHFYNYFKLNRFPQIIIGQDFKNAFYKYYKTTSFPCIAIYDKSNKLVKLYREQVNIYQVIKSINI